MSAIENVTSQIPALAHNPLDGEDFLCDAMFGPNPAARKVKSPPIEPPVRPEHYRIVTISLYLEDIERLDSLVAELKARGHHRANKSQVIRQALAQIDLDKVPRA